jgi:hypothetical protein
MDPMPNYLVERTFDLEGDLGLPGPNDPPDKFLEFVENNTSEGVIWNHSYFSPESRRSFCIYHAPGPEAIRRAARRNGLPVDRITEVCILDPRLRFGQTDAPLVMLQASGNTLE